MTGVDADSTQAGDAQRPPQCVIVAGPNGAGKTTTAAALASEWLGVHRIVNADEIAEGLSGAPELGALEAGKLALRAQARYIEQRQDFALETTLSGRRWTRLLDALETAGYRVTLIYLWVADPALCIARVQMRVMLGGHGVPEADIRRRYDSGLVNFRELFSPRVSSWRVTDATAAPGGELRYVAHGGRGLATTIEAPEVWAQMDVATRAALERTQTPPQPPVS